MSTERVARTSYFWPLASLAGALLLAAIFFGWLRYGVDLFLTFAENGLSLCL